MSKKILSATEIQKLLQTRIDVIHEVVEDGAKINAPIPCWHEEDGNGVNWEIKVLSKSNGYIDQIKSVIEKLRLEVNLKK